MNPLYLRLCNLLPEIVLRPLGRLLQAADAFRNRNRSSREIFSEIHSRDLWGGGSGPGSHAASVVDPYVALIASALKAAGGASVVDLGCGDMAVGAKLIDACRSYTGVDVSPDLIRQLSVRFSGKANARFICLDLTQDELPEGEIALLRQVLQHLSNADILAILPKLRRYREIYVTEHIPEAGEIRVVNADLARGRWNRVPGGSGVFLDQPPFFSPDMLVETVLDIPGVGLRGQRQGRFRTFRIRFRQPT